MEHKNMSRWLALPVVLLLMAALFLPGTVFADPDTDVSVDPSTQNVGTGATFAVGIYVVPDTAIAGMQFSLSFNPSLITANSVTEGNLFSQGGASTYFVSGTIDNVAGTITNVWGVINEPGQTVSSPGTFATISFTAGTAAGTSPIDLSNVIVGDLGGMAVPITVTDGEVVITGAPPPEYTVTFDTDPEATGTITFDGVIYSDGNTVDKTAGTYYIAANPGSGYYFDSWEATGGLSVTSPTSPTTTCVVSGAGTLRMVQTTAPPPEYTITFDTVPAATGTITFDGVSYNDGNTVDKTAGTYDIAANPGSGYYFDSWETSGGLSVTSPNSASTACVISGAGTLSMVQTTTAPPVGGTAHPISKVAILALWIAVGAAIIVGTSLLVRRHRSAAR
jgi:hypothetical protein